MIAVGLLAGCAAPQRHGVDPTQTVVTHDQAPTDRLWDACQNVLHKNRFEMDIVDRRGGFMTTHPETSQQVFEFWRHDVDTAHDLWEATFRTVRRSVRIDLGASDPDGTTQLTIQVIRERFATPGRQINNSMAVLRMFGHDLPSAQTGERLTPADDEWLADGRDPAMERYLLDRILAVAAAQGS